MLFLLDVKLMDGRRVVQPCRCWGRKSGETEEAVSCVLETARERDEVMIRTRVARQLQCNDWLTD